LRHAIDDDRVVAAASSFFNLRERLVDAERRPIRPVRCHSFDHVGDCDGAPGRMRDAPSCPPGGQRRRVVRRAIRSPCFPKQDFAPEPPENSHRSRPGQRLGPRLVAHRRHPRSGAGEQLDRLEDWVRTLTWQSVVGLLDMTLDGGLIRGTRLLDFFRSRFEDKDISSLAKAYGAIATELLSGREVWLREGSVMDAVRASMALPGLFTPKRHEGRLLVDGGLVNPVPVSLCRAMGADLVIAVDLNWDLMGRHSVTAPKETRDTGTSTSTLGALLEKLPLGRGRLRGDPAESNAMPTILEVVSISLNIMQVRITRSRLAGEPAEVMIRPRVSNLALMDFHRADVAIAEGRRAAEQALPFLRESLGA
jgi:NTE family protein